MYERMSSLTDEELEALEEQIIGIVCGENPSRAEPLASSTLYEMLVDHGRELPDFAVHDALQGLRRVISVGLGGPRNPHTDPEARSDGGKTITGVDRGVCEGYWALAGSRNSIHRQPSVAACPMRVDRNGVFGGVGGAIRGILHPDFGEPPFREVG